MQVESFEAEVIEASYAVPVVVDFWAEWCGPCRMLGPVLEGLAEEADGQWRLVKIDVEAHPEIARAYGVRGIPAVKMFSEGEVVGEFTGALPEQAVHRWLEAYLPSESKQALAGAEAALEAGDRARAEEILEGVVGDDPENLDARALLAGLVFTRDADRALSLVEAVDESHPMFDRVDAMRKLARLMGLGESGQAGRSENWALYVKGAEALKTGRYADALDAWIEVIRRGGRDVDEDGARTACVALFRFLGEEGEISQRYRRAFSSALY